MIEPPYEPGLDAWYAQCILDQPIVPADAKERDLPVNLLRKCCAYKSCGNAELYLDVRVNPETKERTYSYLRLSNDEAYFCYGNLAQTIENLNYRLLWPIDEEIYDQLMEESSAVGDDDV